MRARGLGWSASTNFRLQALRRNASAASLQGTRHLLENEDALNALCAFQESWPTARKKFFDEDLQALSAK